MIIIELMALQHIISKRLAHQCHDACYECCCELP